MQASIHTDLFEQLSDDKFAKPQLSENTEPNFDVAQGLNHALENPLFYPPISQSVFPGDTIAIALQSDLPHPEIILESLLQHLSSCSIEPSDMVVVISPRMADRLGIPAEKYHQPEIDRDEGKPPVLFPVSFGFHSINFQVHDPENDNGLSYLVANAEGEPIHINRLLVDADVALPVGCPSPGEANRQVDCIFPEFAHATNRARYAKGQGSFVAKWQEIELTNDTLGSFFAIQVVSGPGDRIEEVVCGARKDAIDQARKSTNQHWAFHWPKESQMTVGTVESDSDFQNWDDFANALIAASRVTTSDGPIVIWSEIEVPPDKKTRTALLSQFESGEHRKMSNTLKQVSAIMSERPVYLKSRLGQNAVEELGLGFIKSGDEVSRIASPFSDCLLIRDAHRVQTGTNDEQQPGV